mgnify:CR=1 FL=1
MLKLKRRQSPSGTASQALSSEERRFALRNRGRRDRLDARELVQAIFDDADGGDHLHVLEDHLRDGGQDRLEAEASRGAGSKRSLNRAISAAAMPGCTATVASMNACDSGKPIWRI